MEDKLDKLLAEIEGIKDRLKPDKESRFKRTVHVLEKLVIPVLIGALAWFGSLAATKISQGQLQLAQSAADDPEK